MTRTTPAGAADRSLAASHRIHWAFAAHAEIGRESSSPVLELTAAVCEGCGCNFEPSCECVRLRDVVAQ